MLGFLVASNLGSLVAWGLVGNDDIDRRSRTPAGRGCQTKDRESRPSDTSEPAVAGR